MAAGEVSVSVILPTYNRAFLLSRSIRSVLEQTYRDFELIVIDDGSQDNTAAVVRGFRDDRIRYVRLPENRGVSAAQNAGLTEARGEYLAFQGSDDEWYNEKLERQLNTLEASPDASVVYSDMHRVCADGRVLYLHSPHIRRGRLIDPKTRFWQTYMLAMQAVLMRRTCIKNLLFNERLVMFEDLELNLRVAQEHDYIHLCEPLVKYYETQGVTSNRRWELMARRQLVRDFRKTLLTRNPAFLIKETMNVLLRSSLMPIVNQHMTPS